MNNLFFSNHFIFESIIIIILVFSPDFLLRYYYYLCKLFVNTYFMHQLLSESKFELKKKYKIANICFYLVLIELAKFVSCITISESMCIMCREYSSKFHPQICGSKTMSLLS